MTDYHVGRNIKCVKNHHPTTHNSLLGAYVQFKGICRLRIFFFFFFPLIKHLLVRGVFVHGSRIAILGSRTVENSKNSRSQRQKLIL